MGHASFSDDSSNVLRGITRWEIRDRAQGARRAITTAAEACLARFDQEPVADVSASELYAAYESCRQMEQCVREYAAILGALGHDSRSAAELSLQAVSEGAGDRTPPRAFLAAVGEWTREGFQSERGGP